MDNTTISDSLKRLLEIKGEVQGLLILLEYGGERVEKLEAEAKQIEETLNKYRAEEG